MGIFDTLFGVSDARVNAAQIDAKAGSRAIRQNAANMSGQLGAQQYSLASSGRGANSALALREAQRRSAMGQQAIGAQSVAQEAMMQQQVAQANQQAQMQANVANANIEMQNDQAFSRGLGGLVATGATAAMLMSDVRAKENVTPLYSDFESKEGLRPAPARVTSFPVRPAVVTSSSDPYAEARAAFGLNVDRRPTNTLEQGAIERRVIEDIQRPELRSAPAQYQSQPLSARGRAIVAENPEILSNRGIATHFRDRAELRDVGVDPDAPQMPFTRTPAAAPASGWSAVRDFGQGLMQSDKRAKEIAFTEGMRAGMRRSPMTPGYTHVPPPGYGAMPSDFAGKEMTADESREALAPVRPVNYRYKEGDAARMAAETGATPAERAMVFRDKRAPRDGIIAQDLQRSPAFADSVMQTPAGLAVERDRALSTNLAATAGQAKVNDEQDEEIRELKRLLFRSLGREVRA